MRACHNNQAAALEALKDGFIRNVALSSPNLIDEILYKMDELGLISKLAETFEEKRFSNSTIPLRAILALCIAAKMKLKNSITDVPYAINDTELLSKIGWNIVDDEGLEKGLMSEGAVRYFISQYDIEELISNYNDFVQNVVYKELDLKPDIHILDCSELEVPLENTNYEKAGVITKTAKKDKSKKDTQRGYKIATLRGIAGDHGIIEEIEIGAINTHDLELSKNILMNSKALKEGDVLIQDRGFISRPILNDLKNNRNVDVYMPVKKGMIIYNQAVEIAKKQGEWQAHPNKKRTDQTVQFVSDLGDFWEHDENDVPLNACVVRDTSNPKEEKYFVFITTDISKSEKSIINTYELRPEIEEDYRQLKDFWNLDDFQSTKYIFIVFHIVVMLFGYLFFQIFKETDEGAKFRKKSLPVAQKNYKVSKLTDVIVYTEDYFGIFSFSEFLRIYVDLPDTIRLQLETVISQV